MSHTTIPLFLFGLIALMQLHPVLRASYQRILAMIGENPRFFQIAAIGAFTGLAYDWYAGLLWRWLAEPTTFTVAALLNFIGVNAWLDDNYHNDFITGTGRYIVNWPCSGMEGVALMVFVLSGLLLLNWQRFASYSLPHVYGIGIGLMLTANILRMVIIAASAEWSGGSETVRAYFHSNAGWILYALVIGWYVKRLLRRKI